VVSSVQENGNAITSSPAFETLAVSRDQGETISSVTERTEMYTLQAPQAFHLGAIVQAHKQSMEQGLHDQVVDQAHLIDSLETSQLHSSLSKLHLVPGVRGN